MTSADLPELTPAEREHSDKLLSVVRREIEAQHGWISFARFMEMALYEPGLGYYSSGASKLGGAGDFVTAPELSPLFSRCLAAQCADVLSAVGGGDILEVGAGTGLMAADMLNELESLDRLPGHYLILEVSADLRQRQIATLSERAARHLKRVSWLDELPAARRGVIVANEVIDALPVDRFRIRTGGINALGVGWNGAALAWSERAAARLLEQKVRAIERTIGSALPEGYTSEVNLSLDPWLHSLARVVKAGAIFFIDYGLPRAQYYRPERHDGTLLCHFRQRFHSDPFINLGLQDIGAWVDFTAAAEAATDAGLEVAGFTTQAHFLMGLGIEQHLHTAGERELVERLSLARQAMLLTLPGEMGERFKVLGLSRGVKQPLRGFAIRDMAASL
ncbi:MAG TPA: SAM-dependent methyltransferase [Steroidobacteraceae bacterium]